jgi:hypothetical protein
MRLSVAAGGRVRGQFNQREGLGFGHRLLAGAFEDEVPGVGVRQGAAVIESGAKAVQQGPVAQADVAQMSPCAGQGGQARPVADVGGLQPPRFQPDQERGAIGRRAGWGGDGQGEHGLHHIGVVSRRAGPGFHHLEQGHRQVTRQQSPQRHGGLVGPDGDPPGAGGVQQAAGPVGFDPGVGAAFAVQDDQQRTGRAVLVVGGAGGGVPAGPGADHQVRLPTARGADDHLMAAERGVGDGQGGLPPVAHGPDHRADHDPPVPVG